MASLVEGQSHALRAQNEPMYLKSGDPGMHAGGTVTGHSTTPSIQQYENIFGPVARDIKSDSQRHKRHQRWHLPDVLKGANPYLTDRVDGLITDATNSPFTRNILPYVYLESPDQKLKWNVYSFDEGIASRVPYEAAARVLPQTKRSFAGYVVRQGLAIAMEHNFMMSEKGQQNFKNQLLQLVGSIQMTNDLDVHVALLTAPSYQRMQNEKYMDTQQSLAKVARRYVDMFGLLQKIPNAMDFLIEDAKQVLKTWGSQPPTFCMCNGKLQAQLNMLPERTDYMTNGPDGAKRLAQGPDLPSYRGLSFINSRKFSMDAGTAPRDLLRRRVRVAEYYLVEPAVTKVHLYDQTQDSFFSLTPAQIHKKTCDISDDVNLLDQCKEALRILKDLHLLDDSDLTEKGIIDDFVDNNNKRPEMRALLNKYGKWWDTSTVNTDGDPTTAETNAITIAIGNNSATAQAIDDYVYRTFKMTTRQTKELNAAAGRYTVTAYEGALQIIRANEQPAVHLTSFTKLQIADIKHRIDSAPQNEATSPFTYLLLRPNIEHEMLAVVFGRGGTQELGCTFWGQTEMSCYDDAQHGIWGMSYKYHERALVTNERNLVRVYDVAFDGYNGGMDNSMLDMNADEEVRLFGAATMNKSVAYNGTSLVPFVIPSSREATPPEFPSPLLFTGSTGIEESENRENLRTSDIFQHNILSGLKHWSQQVAFLVQWKRLDINHWVSPSSISTLPGDNCITGNAAQVCMAFHGTMKVETASGKATDIHNGSGHLGPSYPGVASVREGRGRVYQESAMNAVNLSHSV